MLRDTAVAQIQQALGFRTDQATNIVTAMQVFQETLEHEPELPAFLRKPFAGLVTAISVRTVNAPADFLREWDEDQMSYANTDGSIQSLVKDELGFLRVRYTEAAVAAPKKYALVNKIFYLYPLPDQIYTLNGTYYAKDAVLTTNIENKWLANIPELIIGGAGVIIAAGLRDKDALAVFASMVQSARVKVGMVQAAEDNAGSKPVMGGED